MPHSTQTEAPLASSLEEFEFTDGVDTLFIPLYTSQPIHTTDAGVTRAIVIIHGQNRNAGDYFDYAAEAVAGVDGIFIAAPKFATIDDSPSTGQLYWTSGWSQLNLSVPAAGPFRVSSGTAIDDICSTIRSSFPNVSEIVVAGYSAGGQLVTRYAATNTDADLVYLVGAPSSYLYMSATRYGTPAAGDNDYKYGLDNLSTTSYVDAVGAVALSSNFEQATVTTITGSLDNDPAHSSLDTSPEAEAQGANRLERMNFYEDHVVDVYGAGVLATHVFVEVSGVGHNAREILISDAGRTVLRGY